MALPRNGHHSGQRGAIKSVKYISASKINARAQLEWLRRRQRDGVPSGIFSPQLQGLERDRLTLT